MRKIILIVIAVIWAQSAFSQAKKPTVMVVPSDNWCFSRGFKQSYLNQGVTRDMPDYRRALQNDDQLGLVIGRLNSMMSDRGFPLKDLEQSLNIVEQQSARNNMMSSRSGAAVSESPIDLLNRMARADIIMQLTWTVKNEGPKRYVTYNLRGLDAYTGKQVAGAQGVGSPSFSATEDALIEEAVLSNMDNFCAQLVEHFADLQQNGREVAISLHVWDNSEVDFETEFGDTELAEIIDDWFNDNTQEHRYSKSYGTETNLEYDQVRIPIYNEKGKAIDSEGFGNQLRRFLKNTYRIESKGQAEGLGHYHIYIGGK